MPPLVASVTLVAATLIACSREGGTATRQAVEQTVRRSVEAENAGDTSAFLALWTDEGLRSYDAGSRADIASGRVPLGTEQTELRAFEDTTVKGGRGTTIAAARVGVGLYLMRFDLERVDGRWLISGWRFLGPAPPPEGTPVALVRAVDFAFDVDAGVLAQGRFALTLVNAGQEAHEISVLSLPPGTTKAEAVLALGGVRGLAFEGLPPGYSAVGHLAFAQPGQSGTYSLARTLEPGSYALACFLPVGGVDSSGAARVAGAATHVARGMLTDFRVG